jgi:hypothetical protein
MADDITIPPPAPRTVATDEVAGRNFQLVKIVDGTADSTTPAVVDAAGALLVTSTTFVGGGQISDASQPLYASGQAVGGGIGSLSASVGLYELGAAELLSMGGDDVSNIGLLILLNGAAIPWADGDLVVPLTAILSSETVQIDGAEFVSPPFQGSDAVHFRPTTPVRFVVSASPVSLALIATGAIASPITGPLAVEVTAHRIAGP